MGSRIRLASVPNSDARGCEADAPLTVGGAGSVKVAGWPKGKVGDPNRGPCPVTKESVPEFRSQGRHPYRSRVADNVSLRHPLERQSWQSSAVGG